MSEADTERMGPVATFFLRLAFYLLVAPFIGAAVAVGCQAIILGSVDSPGATYFAYWLIALPIAALYVTLFSVLLALSGVPGIGYVVVICSFLLALVLTVPVHELARLGSPTTAGTPAWQVFLIIFVPVTLTGLACWLIAGPLHRRSL